MMEPQAHNNPDITWRRLRTIYSTASRSKSRSPPPERKQNHRKALTLSATMMKGINENDYLEDDDKVDYPISKRRSSDPLPIRKADESKKSVRNGFGVVTGGEYVMKKIEDGTRQAGKGKYLKAKKSYLEALSKADDLTLDAQIYLAIGNISVTQRYKATLEEDKFEHGIEAVNYYGKAIAILSEIGNNELLNVRAVLGNIHYSMKDYSAAYDQYARAAVDMSMIDTCVLAQMLYNYAMIKFVDEEYKEAQFLLTKFLEYKNSNEDPVFHIPQYDAVYYLGISLFHSGDYDMATDALDSFLKESEQISDHAVYDIGKVHICLAEMYERKTDKNHDLALEHYTKYLDCTDPKLTIILQSDHRIERNIESRFINVLESMGHLHMKAENFTMAGNCFREAYYGAKLIPEKEDLSLYSLARQAYECYTKTLYNLNRKLMLQEIISILERIQDSDKPDYGHPVPDAQMADNYEALGQIYKESGEIELALKGYWQCLELRKRYLTEEDPIIGEVRCKIALYLYKVGEYNKSLENCQIACKHSNDMTIRKKALCLKGTIYAEKLDKNNCVSAFKEAIALVKASSNENCSDLSEIYEYFAQAYFRLDYFYESVDCFHQAYKLAMNAETKPGKCISLLNGMVDSYRMMQEYKLALLACKKILFTQKEISLPHSDDEAQTMEIMGDLHVAIGATSDYFNAVELYRLSANIFRKHHGPSDRSLLTIYVKMANVLGLKLNEHEKALRLFRLVVRSSLKNKADITPFIVLTALEGQGDVLFQKYEHKSALRKYESVMKYLDRMERMNVTWEEKYEDCIHDTRVGMFCKIGSTYKTLKRYDLALENLEEGLEVKLQLDASSESSDDTITARLFYEIGLVHFKLNHRETALGKFNEASEILGNISALSSEGESLSQDIKRQLGVLNRILPFGLCKW